MWGSGWGTADLNATNAGGVITLSPNTNAYNADDAYWSNGADGNKFMEASYYLENPGDNLGWAGQTLSFSGNVDSSTLDSRYTASAFIKVLDVDAGYATVALNLCQSLQLVHSLFHMMLLQGNIIGQIWFNVKV